MLINKKKLLVLVSFGSLLFSCKKPSESYPNEPQIEFKSFAAFDKYNALLIYKFTDGDGDIGLKPEDTLGDFNKNSIYYYNLYIKAYYKNAQGIFKDTLIFDTQTNQIDSGLIRQRIQYIENTTKDSYLRGEIQVSLNGYRQSTNHKIIKYKIFMYDRAKNKSNVIESPELLVP